MKSLSFLSKSFFLFCSVLSAVESNIEVPTGNSIAKKDSNEIQTKVITRIRRVKKIKTPNTVKDKVNSISPVINSTKSKVPENIEKVVDNDEAATPQITKISGKGKTKTKSIVKAANKKNKNTEVNGESLKNNTEDKFIQVNTSSKIVDDNSKQLVTDINTVENLLNEEGLNFNNSTGNTGEEPIQADTAILDDNSKEPSIDVITVEKLIQVNTPIVDDNSKEPSIDIIAVEKLIQVDTTSKTPQENSSESVSNVNTVETSTPNSTTKTRTKRTKIYAITSTLRSKLGLIERRQIQRSRKEFLETLKNLENKTVILRPVIKTNEKIFLPIKIVRPILVPTRIEKIETTVTQHSEHSTLSAENKISEKVSNDSSVPVVIVGKPCSNFENGKCIDSIVTGENIKFVNQSDNNHSHDNNVQYFNNSISNEVIVNQSDNNQTQDNNVQSFNNSVSNEIVGHPVNNEKSCPDNIQCNNNDATSENLRILYPTSLIRNDQENKVYFLNSEYKILLPHKIDPILPPLIYKTFDSSSQEFNALKFFIQFSLANPKTTLRIFKNLDSLVKNKKITDETFFKLYKLSAFHFSEQEQEYVKDIFYHYRSLIKTVIKNESLNILIKKMNLLFTDKFVEFLANSSPSQVIEVIKTALYNKFSLHFDLAFRHIGEEILIIADQSILFANEELKLKGQALEECLTILQRDGNSKDIENPIIGRITELVFELLEIASNKGED